MFNLPLPWTLGPLVFIGIAQVGLKQEIVWPVRIRDVSLAVLGYAMGRAFTPDTGLRILALLPSLVVVTLISVALCLIGGVIFRRYTSLSLTTVLFGSMPGGLTQMAAFCEDMEGADTASITLMQTVRVITVVFIVPFLALHGIADEVNSVKSSVVTLGWEDIPTLILSTGIITLAIYLSKYVKIPGKFILPPIIATAVMSLLGISLPALPPSIISIAQVCVGIRMGMSFDVDSLVNWKKTVIASFFSVLGVIILLFGVNLILVKVSSTSLLTAFIATAPGGMAEMGLTAMMVNADLPTVVAFQLFRLLFVYIIAIPVVTWWLGKIPKKTFKI
jgi:uncharacterized protein